ncbi:NlpC P60 family protein [Loigolactobacillus bifermentans DSM 20003]|uniref:NlpC P60 family protein n=2 Tax=Loigolactobacillus bifermentans TaxID=1607 RepID=A0A0R1GMZ5_9LACO|nr:NlpC P60 family protein [Loigolactobacillus bifermentans DSM 20003]
MKKDDIKGYARFMKMKSNLVKGITAGVIGVAGATVISLQTSTAAQAATTGTVTYHGGATTVWNNVDQTPQPVRYLTEGDQVNITASKQVYGETWYNIGQDQWVPGKYLQVTADQQTATVQAGQAQAQTSTAATTTAQAATTQAATTAQTGATYQAAGQQATSQQQAAATTASTTPTATGTYSNNTAQAIVNAAKSQLGVPYAWGGTGNGGFDCSGLTQYAYNQAGKQIGRTTTAQESAGSRVSVSQLQAGDLMFWGNQGSTYHTAVYIGNNQYIAAPQPGQSVEVQSINSYFQPSFGVHVN